MQKNSLDNYQAEEGTVDDLREANSHVLHCISRIWEPSIELFTRTWDDAYESKEQAKVTKDESIEYLDKVKESENDVQASKERVEKIEYETKQACKKAGVLLSDTTGFELAKMYHERKQECRKKQKLWGLVLAVSIIVFLVVAFCLQDNLLKHLFSVKEIDFLRLTGLILVRILLFVPETLLAFFAAKRIKEEYFLEEAYAHKKGFMTLMVGYRAAIEEAESSSGYGTSNHINDLYKTALRIAAKDVGYIFGFKGDPDSDVTDSETEEDLDKTNESNDVYEREDNEREG